MTVGAHTATGSMAALAPGFGDPVHDAQSVFRAVLRAMSRPGEIQALAAAALRPPAPLGPAAGSVCLALLDFETRVWIGGGTDDPSDVMHFIGFHTGASRLEGAEEADFALVLDGATTPRLDSFNQGSDAAPERSTTLVVQVSDLAGGDGWRLTGPGIETETRLDVTGLRGGMAEELAENHAHFPCGVDLILCAGDRLAALPRTTKVEG